MPGRRRRNISNARDTARVWGLDDMVPEVMAEPEHAADLVGNLTAAQHAALDHTGVPGVPSGAGSPVAPIIKTADFNITAADYGKMFSNQGATGPIWGTFDPGLPLGFEVTFYIAEQQILGARPSSGEALVSPQGATFPTGRGNYNVSLSTFDGSVAGQYSFYLYRKMSAGSLLIVDAYTSPERTQLAIARVAGLDASSLIAYNAGLGVSPQFFIRIVQSSPPNSVLGTVDENNVFTPGTTFPSPVPIYLEVQNILGFPNVLRWPSQTQPAKVVVTLPSSADSNKRVGGTTLDLQSRNGLSFFNPQTDTYWLSIDEAGWYGASPPTLMEMFERQVAGGSIRGFEWGAQK